jgi:MFS family permease
MVRGLGRDVAVTAIIMGGSALGDAAARVALVLRVHEGGGSAWAVTALLLASVLPAVFLARRAGALVDRHDSRVLMVGCALVQALVCLPLAVSSSIGVLVALVAGLAALATVTGPARTALVPDMVGPQNLLKANAVLRGADAIGRMAGWSLGGFVTGMLGSGPVLLLDAASFAVLAAGSALIRTRRLPGSASSPRSGERVWLGRTVEPILLVVAGSTGLVLMFLSTTTVAQVFFIKDVLGASDTAYGVVGACWMVGMVLAVPVVAPGRSTRSALVALAVASEAVTGVALFGAGMSSSPVMIGIWYVLAGLGSSSMMIAGAALIGLVAPSEARGRVLAVYSTLVNVALVAALVLSVGLMNWLGARGVFLAAGALVVIVAAVAAGALRILPELAARWAYDRPRLLRRSGLPR